MPSRDVFALDRAGFNGFLFAPIGTEADGSCLTVLSALARLGEDPWAKAALWARMPKAVASEALTATITQMPVTPADQLAAAHTAARLVQLLSPAASAAQQPGFSRPQPNPKWATVLVILACMIVLVGGAILVSRHVTGTDSPLPELAAAPASR